MNRHFLSRRDVLAGLGISTLAGMQFARGQGIELESRATLADNSAGSWRMLVLSSPSQIAVPAPAAVSDPAYQADLAAVKAAQSQITEGRREALDYWSRGGMIRWTEILLELVAKLNLPPAPRADGSYVFPDSTNPFADPNFPFANPPYAARAYAYMAVAHYEALKACWYYKYLYSRQAPYVVDSGVRLLSSPAASPAYPNEDAVMAGVATTLLQLLFPTEVEAVTLKAGEQRDAALISGRATPSDISAGFALGQAVANVVITRARGDGMGAAIGNAALWQSLADQATARGEIPWRSLETPPRPPMLPLFGRVLPWSMTAADVVAERPAPPPSTGSAQMARELAEVKSISSKLSRAQMAIAYKWSDGAGTPTPPGRWNFTALPYVADAGYSEVRAARAFALLNMAIHDAGVCTWDTKYLYFNPRPSQLDKSIKTVIGLPNFPAYISGHSTFSAAASEVLSYLFPSGAQRFAADRDEASISRLYGAIHYRSDVEVGKDVGKKVAAYTLRVARADGADF